MSTCTRQINKPVEEMYVKCDKCEKEIAGYYSQFGIGIPLVMQNRMTQVIGDPSGRFPEKVTIHDLCPDCYKKFIHWLDIKED